MRLEPTYMLEKIIRSKKILLTVAIDVRTMTLIFIIFLKEHATLLKIESIFLKYLEIFQKPARTSPTNKLPGLIVYLRTVIQ